jgi:predicted RNA-binding protein with PIN domain
MRPSYLIDGYNLLHALGILRGPVGPHDLEQARSRLLALIHAVHEADPAAVTVVFDARGAPPGLPAHQEYRGIQVRFAVGYAEADDLIEVLIQSAPVPQALYVVSDDQRLREAARRRRCQPLTCQDYLDHVQRRPNPRRQPPADKQASSAEDNAFWAQEFADLEQDPTWQELFRPYPFEE